MKVTPMIVAVAPNGARRTKADHPGVPITTAEVARDAAACREAGAVLIHLHVRDGAGRHSLDPDLYAHAMAAVRREAGPELLVQMTTEAIGLFTPREQMAAVRAVRPEALSVAVRELVPDPSAEPTAAHFLAECVRDGMLLQYILYTRDEVARFHDLRRRGVLPDRNASVLFVLGRLRPPRAAAPPDLDPFVTAWSGDVPWFACAFGAQEGACALAAARQGGHARVGFENNFLLAGGAPAPGNAALVSQLVAGMRGAGRRPATHREAVALLGGR